MKLLQLIGGLLGFGIGMACSWARENPWSTCLWHASLAAYATGLMMRWWGRSLRKSLAEALNEAGSAPRSVKLSNATK